MSFSAWERRIFLAPWPVRIWRSLRLSAALSRFNRRRSKNQPKGTP